MMITGVCVVTGDDSHRKIQLYPSFYNLDLDITSVPSLTKYGSLLETDLKLNLDPNPEIVIQPKLSFLQSIILLWIVLNWTSLRKLPCYLLDFRKYKVFKKKIPFISLIISINIYQNFLHFGVNFQCAEYM